MSLTSRIILSMILAMVGGVLLKFINDAGFLGEIGQLIFIDFFRFPIQEIHDLTAICGTFATFLI